MRSDQPFDTAGPANAPDTPPPPEGPGAPEAVDDEAALRAYASARRAALSAAELAREGADRATLTRVADAMSAADRSLARCDDAWLDLRVGYLELLAASASAYRLRREPWAESIAVACRYRGPTSEAVARLRTAARSVAGHVSAGEARRLERSRQTLDDALQRPDAPAGAVRATWRLAKWYRHLFLAEPLAHAVTRTVDWLPHDALRHAAACTGAQLCADVGQLERARDLYEIGYAAAAGRLAGRPGFAARCELARTRQRLAEYHLMNGEVARAEALTRTSLEALPGLRDAARRPRETTACAEVGDGGRQLLADCLLVAGRRAEAHAAYRAAHSALAVVERPTPREARATRALWHAVLFTARAQDIPR
ncbi:hypothetical protein [Streptomyces sp. NPDC057702]|uniref:hypothetical protein n=1 Tax=unclassified Streptomyces TaxID=2593676 RepID=UPI00368BF329